MLARMLAAILLLGGVNAHAAAIFTTFSSGAAYGAGAGFGTSFTVTANGFTVPPASDHLLDGIDLVIRGQGLVPIGVLPSSGFRLYDTAPQGGPGAILEFYSIRSQLPTSFTMYHLRSTTHPRLEAGARYLLAAYSTEAGLWAQAAPVVRGPFFTGPNLFFSARGFVPGEGNLSAFQVNGTAVPEPGCGALLLAGCGLLAARRKSLYRGSAKAT